MRLLLRMILLLIIVYWILEEGRAPSCRRVKAGKPF